MSRKAVIGFIFLFVTMALRERPVEAHCGREDPPIMKLRYPKDGMAIQTECYPGFGNFCYVDTFFRDTLMRKLVNRYRDTATKHVFFGYVDSVHNFMKFDTNVAQGVVDTIMAEDVWMSVHSVLKGSVPEKHLFYRVVYLDGFPQRPLAITYLGLVDTPFIAFATNAFRDLGTERFEMISEMGVGPVDGCAFEPTAFMVINDRIHKKDGDREKRMPGVSVSVKDFLRAVGLPDRPAPKIREAGIRFRYNGTSIRMTPVPGLQREFQPNVQSAELNVFNLKGQNVRAFNWLNRDRYSARVGDLPMGSYILRLRGATWSKTVQETLSGQPGSIDTVVIPKKHLPLGR